MPVVPSTTLPVPIGMDAATDPVLLGPDKAQKLQNLLPGFTGILRGNLSRRRLLPVPADATIDGLAYYYGTGGPATDRLLWITGGTLYAGVLASGAPVPTLTGYAAVGSGFTPGVRVRHASFEQEIIFVQADGGINALRYDGTGLFQLGISPPPAPSITFISNGEPAPPPPHSKLGIIHYRMTYLDSKFRESSLSPATTHDYGKPNGDGLMAHILPPPFTDPQALHAYVYATTDGGEVYYRIGTFDKDPVTSIITPTFINDNNKDEVVSSGSAWPDVGSNTIYNVPNKASCVVTHKNYVIMNDMTDPAVVQVSNLGSPTQWAAFSTLPDLGATIRVSSYQQDRPEQMLTFGSVLAILKKHSGMYAMLGDIISEFEMRAIQSRPCISADAFTRCDNELWYLSDDGVYSIDFTGTFLLHKVSKEIEPYFNALGRMPGGRSAMQRAVACYAERIYYLAIDCLLFSFNFDVGGWGIVAL